MSFLLHHLSDLHFGRHRPAAVDAYFEHCALPGNRPDALVLSGDFVQVANHREFFLARDFLARVNAAGLPKPFAVPGNHDVPRYSVWERVVTPLARVEALLGTQWPMARTRGPLWLYGLCSATRWGHSLDWSLGVVTRAQVDAAVTAFATAPADALLKVLVMHHQPWPSAFDAGITPTKWLDGQAIKRLAQAGCQLVLSGHTHMAGCSEQHGLVNHSASTAFSDRTRGEPNSFNRVLIGDDGSYDVDVVVL